MSRAVPKLSRDNVEAIYPLRPVQLGMLFHELQSAGASPYFRQVAFKIAGTVDPGICEATWNRLMARHCLLRSVFDYEKAPQPVQIVLKELDIDFGYEDARGPASDARVAAWRDTDAKRGFHLRRDRLMRVRLFRVADERYEMVWSNPHILLDGWSGSILTEEFLQLYAAARRGQTLALPAPPDPGAYLSALARRDDEASRVYWTALLAGYDELAALPRDRHRPSSAPAPKPETYTVHLDRPEADGIAALAAAHGVTVGTFFQALWGLLLGGWTDRQDVVFGVVVSGRSVDMTGVESLVGLFINALPVRVRFRPEQTFADLLRDLQRQAIAAFAHDHAALSEVQARSALLSGLLDHLVVIENYPEAGGADADTGFVVTGADSCERSNYDFGLIVEIGASGISLSLPFDALVFSPQRIASIGTHLRNLIGQVLADPARSLRGLDIQGAEERMRLESFAEGPPATWPQEATLADLWHRQVERTPDRVAVVAGGERLTYAALDRLATGVAHRLRREGLGDEEIVGVLAERGPDRIVALLGILKAGGVYLPLSPAFPDERLRFMIGDTGCSKVLADPKGAARMRSIAPDLARPIAGIAADTEGTLAHEAERGGASPGSLAYVIYTSGSTGQPKGVALAHTGFVNMITAQIAGFGVGPEDAVLQFASCSFDASLSEIFMTLLAGGRLVIVPDEAIRDGDRLLAMMAAEKVTVATLPPSYLRALGGADLSFLRVLITAGEAPDPRDVRHYAGRLRYFNAYGPTEASVCASWHEVRADAPYPDGIPIGRPIANTRMEILDGWGRPMPLGAVGEIHLAGPGLALRYLGLPEATAERFFKIGNRRCYATGDLGRWLEDGSLLYLGRRDEQVKVDGHRIEPGEIENRLREHADVVQAVVALREPPRRLVAYVVLRRPVEPEELRGHLAATLPGWMVPAAIVALPSLPLTPAGKVDRRALPEPTPSAAAGDTAATATEAAVAEAFAQVLGGGPYGRRTSFASAGGGSLKAIQLLAHLRRLGLASDLRVVLSADTVRAIAAAIDGAGTGMPIEAPAAAGGAVAMTPTQHWFLRSHDRDLAHLNHQLLLETATRLEIEVVSAAVATVWRRHEALRLRFAERDGQWTATLAPDEPAPRPRQVDLRQPDGDGWAALAADVEAQQRTFDLGGGPLFRAVLYRLPEGDALLFHAHHLVVDAVSWQLLLEELLPALGLGGTGQGSRLPDGALPFSAWTARLGEWSRSEALEEERAYWREIAEAAIPPLPTDHPVTAHGYGDTAIVAVDLGTRAASLPDVRIVAGLLDALATALHAWDGRREGRVQVSTHGRISPFPGVDPSRTVGWLAAEFPVLLACPGGGGTAAEIEARLASLPSAGLGWGALCWLAAQPVQVPQEEIGLNFLGVIDTAGAKDFRLSQRLPNASVGAMGRHRLIEIEGSIAEGRLDLALRYAPSIHERPTIEAFAHDIAQAFAREMPRDTGWKGV
jgi:amino acid adenylation domain-containing protein/non-ribosomal peptide synthase protein (TIGR01720 family)